MVQRRQEGGKLDFNRDWKSYKEGFGRHGPKNELWIGNEALHHLTGVDTDGVHLRIVLTSSHSSDVGVAEFQGFKVGRVFLVETWMLVCPIAIKWRTLTWKVVQFNYIQPRCWTSV